MDIFKLLPKTNCGECRSPSCLAFAMKMAGGKACIGDCPHLSEESRSRLEEMMAPPIRELVVRRGEKEVVMGGEKVLFRHDESFYRPTAIAIRVPSGLSTEELKRRISQIESLVFERAGQKISVDMIALENPGDGEYVRQVYHGTSLPVAIKTTETEIVREIAGWPSHEGVLLFTDVGTAETMADLLKEKSIPLGILASDLDGAANAGDFLRKKGIKNGIIGLESNSPPGDLRLLNTIRVEALTGKNRRLGFPVFLWIKEGVGETLEAASAVMKYASGLAISGDDPDDVLPLLTLRQNIFTDPRRPIQVEAKLYSFGDVTPDSPLFLTTNFSLTYFTVAQEIEASRIPAYLLIIDTEGTSVLTAWSADRFNAATIIKGYEKEKVGEILAHKNIIIPGYVAVLKEDLEEASGLSVSIGPREASGIPEFLRKRKAEVRG